MTLFEDESHQEASLEPIPEAGSLQDPKHSSLFIGHETIEREILALWENNYFPHAIVFNGLKGIGKMTFAYRLARFILHNSSNNDTSNLFDSEGLQPSSLHIPSEYSVFHKIASGGHPDLMLVSRPYDDRKGRYKDEIPVDDIRKVAPFLRKTSSEGGWRVVIIDDANMMNRNGQNALLKILEEPPKRALLILVSHGAGGLLPTIRSRCRYVSLSPLSEADIKTIMYKSTHAQTAPETDLELAAALADGSAGKALALLEGAGLGQIRILLASLDDIKNLTSDQMDSLALSLGKAGDEESIKNFVYIIFCWFERLTTMLVYQHKSQSIGDIDIKIPLNVTLPQLLRLQENVAEHFETCINGALDKRYMIYKTFRMIQDL